MNIATLIVLITCAVAFGIGLYAANRLRNNR